MTATTPGRAGSVGLLVIATGRYLDFARRLAEDIELHSSDGRAVVMNLMTDRVDEAAAWAERVDRMRINPLPLPELRWPEASLLRYEIMQRHWTDIEGDDLVYLDADLRVEKSFLPALDRLGGEPLLGVRHPGYYERGWRGPRGTWETRRQSTAFVPRRKRKAYVCGGVWMGTREGVGDLSRELQQRVARDQANGITAVWHDESHWNWFTAEHGVPALSPAYCYVPDYAWLRGIDPVIVAVDKGPDFLREATDEHVSARWKQS